MTGTRAKENWELREGQDEAAVLEILAREPGLTVYLIGQRLPVPGPQPGELIPAGPLPLVPAPAVLVMHLLKTLGRRGRVRKEEDPAGTRYYLTGQTATGEQETGTMTVRKDPAAKARTQRLTAARKSLRLIIEGAAVHQAAMEQGQLPDSGFLASALKYHEELAVLRVLDGLASGTEAAPDSDGLIEVGREDVELLAQLARAFVPPLALNAGAGDLLARLEAASVPAQAAVPGSGEAP